MERCSVIRTVSFTHIISLAIGICVLYVTVSCRGHPLTSSIKTRCPTTLTVREQGKENIRKLGMFSWQGEMCVGAADSRQWSLRKSLQCLWVWQPPLQGPDR